MRIPLRTILLPFCISIVILEKACRGSSIPNYVMLEGDCPGPSILFVRHSVQVSLTSNPLRHHEGARRKCSLTFQAQEQGHFLLLHWDAVRLSSASTRVFVKDGQTIPTQIRTGSDRRDYRSFRNQLTLFYYGYPHYDYVRVTVTEIKFALSCDTDEFMCPRGPNSFCIKAELLCNGENNCGDANVSDENYVGCLEKHATTTKPTATPIPVGLVGALAAQPVIVVILIVAFCIIKKRRQKSKEEARSGSGLQRPRTQCVRTQNEYVTLPKSTLGGQQPVIMWDPIRQSVGVHTSPPVVPPPLEPGPRRTLPPTPEEPDTNYINLQREGQQLPLLFPVPDTNAMPLLHTMGLRKASLPKTPPRIEPEVSISEPGYMEINDADVSQPTHRKEHRSPPYRKSHPSSGRL